MAPPATGTWPRTTVLVALAAVAAGLAALPVLAPAGLSRHAGPLLAGATTLIVGVLVHRHSRRPGAVSPGVWRTFAVITALVGAGQLIRGVTGAGVNPQTGGPADVALAATAPLALVLWYLLARAAGGRASLQVALDGAVALIALGVLVEVVLPAVAPRAAGADRLLTSGYPAASAVLVAVGLVTLASVGPARRRAAGWLLLALGALAVTLTSGSIAAAEPAAGWDALTAVAYVAGLAATTLALDADPGPGTDEDADPVVTPLAGVLVSYCLAFGVVLLLLAGWAGGRPISVLEAVATGVLLAATLARTLLWAADATRLTRQVLRAEAYFRTLVHSAADITIVLDQRGAITWASGAGKGPAAWAARDLEGRPLLDFVHPEDRADLVRVLAAADLDDPSGRSFRLRTRDGGWRPFEPVRVIPSEALHAAPEGAPRGAARGGNGLVLHLRDVDDRRSGELELERLAYTDYLTGLPNRARLMAALAGARSRAAAGEAGCLLLLDLDGFKAVNDVAGHEAGDLLLIEVADRLRATVRDRDLVGRLGGDEFAVVVRGGLSEATALAERVVTELAGVHRAVPTPGADPDLVFDVSCSIGVTALDPVDEVAVTIRSADLALRAAKAAGKGCVRRHGEAADSATGRRTRLARDLPDALARGELRLEYQPVVGTVERRVLGVEALLRWDHPVLGPVPPAEFVPLAEDDGLIVPLQRWVLEQATAELAGLLRQGRDLQLGVNISVRHLQSGSLVPDVAAALARSGLPPRRLMLEVTESLFLGQPDRADGDLQTLHDMGCVISLDDFGRGYSTFAHLTRLPVDVLKMDREFLAGIEADERSAALVHTVIELGRRLSIDVVAEGVETPGELAALQVLGCRYLQGHLLGGPVGPEGLAAVIDSFDATLLDGEPAAAGGR
ncbi:putative bifunctional diguanylate cyclase/phosphodiesterase [Modestobacter roseus]|uniref:putative bifunctional diguanylate cyclase/phosphodiesterase n=1 Tax=Modestobacter roseus TaxID=1181884 RepID=UPI0034DDFA27